MELRERVTESLESLSFSDLPSLTGFSLAKITASIA